MPIVNYNQWIIMLIISTNLLCSFCMANELNFGRTTAGYPKILARKDYKINLGTFEKDQQVVLKLSNKSNSHLQITAWLSPCPCLEIIKMPLGIPPGKTAELVIKVLPQGYSGRIIKHIPVTLEYKKKRKILFMPIMFTTDNDYQPKQKKHVLPFMTFIKYEGGKMDDQRYTGTAAWLFGGKNCPQCNYLKRYVFPKLFKPTDKIVQVDLNQRAGLLLLLALEERLKINKPLSPPGLFLNNKMYYGSKSIKKLLQKNTSKKNEKLFD